MELINSNSEKKIQQIDIFKKYATLLKEVKSQDNDNTDNEYRQKNNNMGELVLQYDDFIELISNSRKLYSTFTDHSFNLNQVPSETFGCIFFAIDEQNKGYLTISDWFHFNNILEYDNYHIIILYEFFRKFDVQRIKASQASSLYSSDPRVQSINYSNKFLSFDELLLNIDQFKSTLNFLHDCVKDEFIRKNNLFLNWDDFRFLKFYECFPYRHKESEFKTTDPSPAYLTLNSLVTILQSDLKNEKLFIGFERLAQRDLKKNNYTLSKNQLIYILKLFYSHRVSADIFESLNLSNTSLLKSNNNAIPYNVFKDIFYLFQNFDLLNQVLIKYVTVNNLSEKDLREHVLTKRDFMKMLNDQYNKVNNITEFSPSQINLLFSIVANSKNNNRINNLETQHHQDSKIDEYIQNEYTHGKNPSEERLESFNRHYHELSDGFTQSSPFKKISNASTSLIDSLFGDKSDLATMNSNLTIQDFMKILNPNYLNDVVHQLEVKRIKNESLYTNYYFYPIFDSIYNFTLGSVAGCIGATIVYPIDFIKTRMQAQRSLSKYKNSLDCLVKVIRAEGIRGVYSGLGFQLIGVAPEKAIKLTVNDYLRNNLADNRGKLSIVGEILSGASAGTCQVIFTNPIEIVKIRLQVKSEYAVGSDVTAVKIIRKLGFRGLYKGVAACLMRDVPFSAIYFPTYAHLKKDMFNFDPNDKTKRSRLKTWELLLAGGLAGMPSAFLTTPFDVIKTRLQIDPKKGETRYTGIIHAAKTILREEHFRSFFKGGGARVLRSSPQFGFTLAAYELFKGIFPMPDHGNNIVTNNNDGSGNDDIPSIASSFTNYFNTIKKSNHYSDTSNSKSTDFFSPVYDPYSSNYLNYYYKSCQVAKTFIDLDNNFSKFDHDAYSKFYNYLQDIGKEDK